MRLGGASTFCQRCTCILAVCIRWIAILRYCCDRHQRPTMNTETSRLLKSRNRYLASLLRWQSETAVALASFNRARRTKAPPISTVALHTHVCVRGKSGWSQHVIFAPTTPEYKLLSVAPRPAATAPCTRPTRFPACSYIVVTPYFLLAFLLPLSTPLLLFSRSSTCKTARLKLT